ncbi:MAG: flagellar protein FlgN [Treponema sp.]|jgi:septal ring factor EnvC (AmiA/AmiB activator)|nr:flagellar protein FlgN [Treponema sp.]
MTASAALPPSGADARGFPPAAVPVGPEELGRRVRVLKRFRELLQAQRDRFHQYLEVLEKQRQVIETGTAEDLSVHIELEERLAADIIAIQRVLDPLDAMYRSVKPVSAPELPAGAAPSGGEVSSLKAALGELHKDAVSRTRRNKELLSQRMDQLRGEIKTLQRAIRSSGNTLSIYGRNEEPAFIDIQG